MANNWLQGKATEFGHSAVYTGDNKDDTDDQIRDGRTFGNYSGFNGHACGAARCLWPDINISRWWRF
jgi:hypothetical protein